jgi:hypothetical protein
LKARWCSDRVAEETLRRFDVVRMPLSIPSFNCADTVQASNSQMSTPATTNSTVQPVSSTEKKKLP